MSIKDSKKIQKAINEHFSTNTISLEAVGRMQPVTKNSKDGNDYTILALQYGDLTILVWVQYDEKNNVIVRNVKAQAW